MRDLDHVTEIDRVLQGQATGRDGLVSASWRRCVEAYGLDPTRPEPAHVVTAAELRAHREQAERLIAIARSGLQALFRQVAGQNYVLLLSNAEGVTVDFFGDQRFEDDLRAAGLHMGYDWSEDRAGTSGVGSCLVTGEAVTIHQTDHFGFTHTSLSCTAAPIYDTSGKLAAVLDISLLRSPQPKTTQNLALNLVQSSVRRVEMANLMAMTRRDWVLRFSTSPEFLEVDPDAAVALDAQGRIIGVTRAAAQALSPLSPDGTVVGQRMDAFLDLSIDDLPDLMRGRPTEERVIRLRDGRGLFGHAIAPQSAARMRRVADPGLPGALSSFAGADPDLRQTLTEAARLARTRVPLLIRGETGTGKERLARALHVCDPEDRPFLVLPCAGLRPERLDDLARTDHSQSATLFLDGVEDLLPDTQDRLLSFLSSHTDLRLIAATRVDLARLSRDDLFRTDLFFRLAGAKLDLPPLRLRKDFDWLLDRLLRQRATRSLRFSAAARTELTGRDWPGNIRELISTLDVATALADGEVIDLSDLPPPALAAEASSEPAADLKAILDACDWNMSRVARRLGVNRSTVLRRVQKLGLSRPIDPGFS